MNSAELVQAISALDFLVLVQHLVRRALVQGQLSALGKHSLYFLERTKSSVHYFYVNPNRY